MPRDFKNKSFQKVLRGYAPEEVEEYIAYINEEYRKLERRTADSERKLALALKKLDENAKNGGSDSVGPAAREAAARLIRDAENKSSEIIANAEKDATENAERIIGEAKERAEMTVNDAVREAEAILDEAKREVAAHRDDVKNARETAHDIYNEIDSFREKLYALYNEHLDALEGVTDCAKTFIDKVDKQAPEEIPAGNETENVTAEISREEETEPDVDNVPNDDIEDIEEETEYTEEIEPEDTEVEEEVTNENSDEIAGNLAFMDRIFSNLQDGDDEVREDVYIDIPDEEEVDENSDELPQITIDWKKRSAVSADEISRENETEDEDVTDEENAEERDFRSSDAFDESDDDYAEEEYSDDFGENYDEYSPDDTIVGEESEIDEEDDEDEEEPDEYHDMDQIFNEDKSKRDMSLTDEFNIIFDESKSNQNVKEISRQPIIAPEAPKNAKKHTKF